MLHLGRCPSYIWLFSLKAFAWLPSEMLNPAAAFGPSGYFTAITLNTKLENSVASKLDMH